MKVLTRGKVGRLLSEFGGNQDGIWSVNMKSNSDFGMPRMAQRIQTTHRTTAHNFRACGDTSRQKENLKFDPLPLPPLQALTPLRHVPVCLRIGSTFRRVVSVVISKEKSVYGPHLENSYNFHLPDQLFTVVIMTGLSSYGYHIKLPMPCFLHHLHDTDVWCKIST